MGPTDVNFKHFFASGASEHILGSPTFNTVEYSTYSISPDPVSDSVVFRVKEGGRKGGTEATAH